MSEFTVRNFELQKNEDSLDGLARNLSSIQGRVDSVRNSLAFQIASSNSIRFRLRNVSNDIQCERQGMKNMSGGLEQVRLKYGNTENHICGQAQAQAKWETFIEEFQGNYGWKEILSGTGYIGTIYGLINGVKDADSLKEYIKAGRNITEFIDEAADTYKRYKKIGNAVGGKTSMGWWFKKVTGLKKLGRASTAKNPVTRFWNNLTNKTSPFREQFTDIIDGFKGKKGVGKAVASWGTVLVDGVLNWFDNKEEQANSNGVMSDGRVVAETISETVIDTALTYGTSIVVGTAVTTVLGTVAAPGVAVVAISGLIAAGVNAGVKALTGKTTTEWLSDTILDGAKGIGNAMSKATKKTKNSVSKWFKKLSFA